MKQTRNASNRPQLSADIIFPFDGLLNDFNFAATIEGQSKSFSTQMYLPMRDERTKFERTLLTNIIRISGIDSLFLGQLRVPTPNLDIRYQPNLKSTFWRS